MKYKTCSNCSLLINFGYRKRKGDDMKQILKCKRIIVVSVVVLVCFMSAYYLWDTQKQNKAVHDISEISSTFMDEHKNIVLLQTESQDDSYLTVVDQDGKWNELYDLKDVYETLGYDEKENTLYVVGSQKILKISKETEEVNESIDYIEDVYEKGISYAGEDVYVQSVYHSSKDARVSFNSEKQYYGHILMENIPFPLIPAAIVVK